MLLSTEAFCLLGMTGQLIGPTTLGWKCSKWVWKSHLQRKRLIRYKYMNRTQYIENRSSVRYDNVLSVTTLKWFLECTFISRLPRNPSDVNTSYFLMIDHATYRIFKPVGFKSVKNDQNQKTVLPIKFNNDKDQRFYIVMQYMVKPLVC